MDLRSRDESQARAALATVGYLLVCVIVAWLYGVNERASEANDRANSAESDVSDVRGELEETRSQVEELKNDLESLQNEVAFR
jgi:peptidoglycan hydrolase CwlO-like protein